MIREMIGAALIFLGVVTILLAVLGTYRFRYVLNRMHAAAMVDTMGLLLSIAGLVVLWGVSWVSAKMVLILVFVWSASPVMSHLIARAEVMTHAHLSDECEVKPDERRI